MKLQEAKGDLEGKLLDAKQQQQAEQRRGLEQQQELQLLRQQLEQQQQQTAQAISQTKRDCDELQQEQQQHHANELCLLQQQHDEELHQQQKQQEKEREALRKQFEQQLEQQQQREEQTQKLKLQLEEELQQQVSTALELQRELAIVQQRLDATEKQNEQQTQLQRQQERQYEATAEHQKQLQQQLNALYSHAERTLVCCALLDSQLKHHQQVQQQKGSPSVAVGSPISQTLQQIRQLQEQLLALKCLARNMKDEEAPHTASGSNSGTCDGCADENYSNVESQFLSRHRTFTEPDLTYGSCPVADSLSAQHWQQQQQQHREQLETLKQQLTELQAELEQKSREFLQQTEELSAVRLQLQQQQEEHRQQLRQLRQQEQILQQQQPQSEEVERQKAYNEELAALVEMQKLLQYSIAQQAAELQQREAQMSVQQQQLEEQRAELKLLQEPLEEQRHLLSQQQAALERKAHEQEELQQHLEEQKLLLLERSSNTQQREQQQQHFVQQHEQELRLDGEGNTEAERQQLLVLQQQLEATGATADQVEQQHADDAQQLQEEQHAVLLQSLATQRNLLQTVYAHLRKEQHMLQLQQQEQQQQQQEADSRVAQLSEFVLMTVRGYARFFSIHCRGDLSSSGSSSSSRNECSTSSCSSNNNDVSTSTSGFLSSSRGLSASCHSHTQAANQAEDVESELSHPMFPAAPTVQQLLDALTLRDHPDAPHQLQELQQRQQEQQQENETSPLRLSVSGVPLCSLQQRDISFLEVFVSDLHRLVLRCAAAARRAQKGALSLAEGEAGGAEASTVKVDASLDLAEEEQAAAAALTEQQLSLSGKELSSSTAGDTESEASAASAVRIPERRARVKPLQPERHDSKRGTFAFERTIPAASLLAQDDGSRQSATESQISTSRSGVESGSSAEKLSKSGSISSTNLHPSGMKPQQQLVQSDSSAGSSSLSSLHLSPQIVQRMPLPGSADAPASVTTATTAATAATPAEAAAVGKPAERAPTRAVSMMPQQTPVSRIRRHIEPQQQLQKGEFHLNAPASAEASDSTQRETPCFPGVFGVSIRHRSSSNDQENEQLQQLPERRRLGAAPGAVHAPTSGIISTRDAPASPRMMTSTGSGGRIFLGDRNPSSPTAGEEAEDGSDFSLSGLSTVTLSGYSSAGGQSRPGVTEH